MRSIAGWFMQRYLPLNAAVQHAAPPSADAVFALDRLLQRAAMLSMAAAMGAMLAGTPLHVLALLGGASHSMGAAAWLSAALATLAILAALPALRRYPELPPLLGRGEQGLLLCCAAAAYIAGWLGLLGGSHTLLYFDVAAMGVASLAEGRALELDARRRAIAAAAQLELFGAARFPESPAMVVRGVAGPLGLLFVAATLTAVATQGGSAGHALLGGLATLAVCCPCALGRARASAFAAGSELARRDGWILVSPSALALSEPWRAAIELQRGDRKRLAALGRATRRAAGLNVVSAVTLPALLLPLALRWPVDPLLPAAAMIIAWGLIGLSNRLLLN